MVGSAYLAERRRAHEFEEAQAGFAVFGALEILVARRQYLMPRIFYGAVALDICVDELIQICRISLEFYSYYPPPFGYDTYTFRFTARAQARQAVLSASYNL